MAGRVRRRTPDARAIAVIDREIKPTPMRDSPAIHIGTSGWSYDHWVDILYPRKASSLARLDAYAGSSDARSEQDLLPLAEEALFATWYDRTEGSWSRPRRPGD